MNEEETIKNEEIKEEIKEEPAKLDLSGVKRDEKGRIVPGSASLNPKGRSCSPISITAEQKAYFFEHPDEFKKYCEDIRKDPNMRKHVWDHIDGKPPESLRLSGDASLPFILKIIKDDGKKDNKDEGEDSQVVSNPV